MPSPAMARVRAAIVSAKADAIDPFVVVDPAKLVAKNLSLEDVRTQLAITTTNTPKGNIDGEVRSADGYMGEVGHAYVGPDEPCVCGLRGCLETIVAAKTRNAMIVRPSSRAYQCAAESVRVIVEAGIAAGCEFDRNSAGPWDVFTLKTKESNK